MKHNNQDKDIGKDTGNGLPEEVPGSGSTRTPGVPGGSLAKAALVKAARAQYVERAVLKACEMKDVDPIEVMTAFRGTPQVARARVIAMNACASIGMPISAVARAFNRERRSVHSALRIGRPGREARDRDVLESSREIVAHLRGG